MIKDYQQLQQERTTNAIFSLFSHSFEGCHNCGSHSVKLANAAAGEQIATCRECGAIIFDHANLSAITINHFY